MNIIWVILIIILAVILVKIIFKTIKWAIIIGLIILIGMTIFNYTGIFEKKSESYDIKHKVGCITDEDCVFIVSKGECDFLENSCNYVNISDVNCNTTSATFNLETKCTCKGIEEKRGYCSII